MSRRTKVSKLQSGASELTIKSNRSAGIEDYKTKVGRIYMI